jgi:hypothetical protein
MVDIKPKQLFYHYKINIRNSLLSDDNNFLVLLSDTEASIKNYAFGANGSDYRFKKLNNLIPVNYE